MVISINVGFNVRFTHAEPDLQLAKVIADEADAKELDKFEVWKNIK